MSSFIAHERDGIRFGICDITHDSQQGKDENGTRPGVNFLYLECHCAKLENISLRSIEFFGKLSSFFMTFASNFLAYKKWEKVGHQELCSTPYKQEINPWCNNENEEILFVYILTRQNL
jgi:hypothetical protein